MEANTRDWPVNRVEQPKPCGATFNWDDREVHKCDLVMGHDDMHADGIVRWGRNV